MKGEFKMPVQIRNRSLFEEIHSNPEKYLKFSEDWLKENPDFGIQPFRQPEQSASDEKVDFSEPKDSK